MTARNSRAFGALALILMLSACAGQQTGSSKRLPEVLNAARQNPDDRTASIADCESAISRTGRDIPYEAFFAGLFDVPEAQASRALCTAMIEAVISGDFTRQEQDAFQKPAAERGKGPLGDLMRDLMIARERLLRQQAQEAPQSQACNCGQ